MAENHKLWKFWLWFGPNPLWELIKFIGGSSIMTALGRFVWLEYHKSPVDWIWLLALTLVGLFLAGLATWKEKRVAERSSEASSISALMPSSPATPSTLCDSL